MHPLVAISLALHLATLSLLFVLYRRTKAIDEAQATYVDMHSAATTRKNVSTTGAQRAIRRLG